MLHLVTMTAQQLNEHRLIDLLRAMYPGWHISSLAEGWLAMRLSSLTPAQRKAGVIHSFGRATADELADELGRQDTLY